VITRTNLIIKVFRELKQHTRIYSNRKKTHTHTHTPVNFSTWGCG